MHFEVLKQKNPTAHGTEVTSYALGGWAIGCPFMQPSSLVKDTPSYISTLENVDAVYTASILRHHTPLQPLETSRRVDTRRPDSLVKATS